jgi:methionyl-tRNA formyltransferase
VTQLILLTEPELKSAAAAPLTAATPGLRVAFAPTLAALETALTNEPSRILSVGAGFIVPPTLLARATAGAYNLHPGPPEYPGIFPSAFALYDRAIRFGITLHEMAARVDSGPIVAVDRFAIQPGWDRLALDTATFSAMIALLTRFAGPLTDLATPLPRGRETWSSRLYRRTDFEALCRLPEDVTPEEFAHRLRAVGEGPNHALILTRHGRSFRLLSEEPSVIVRAGVATRAP